MFRFRIVAAKNSMKRQAAASPARPIDGRQVSKTGAREIPRRDRDELRTHGRMDLGSGAGTELLGIEEIRGVNLIVRNSVSRFTLSRTSWQPPRATLQAFFRVSPVRRLEYHNVLYDTSVVRAVKSLLTQTKGFAKSELSTTSPKGFTSVSPANLPPKACSNDIAAGQRTYLRAPNQEACRAARQIVTIEEAT